MQVQNSKTGTARYVFPASRANLPTTAQLGEPINGTVLFATTATRSTFRVWRDDTAAEQDRRQIPDLPGDHRWYWQNDTGTVQGPLSWSEATDGAALLYPVSARPIARGQE